MFFITFTLRIVIWSGQWDINKRRGTLSAKMRNNHHQKSYEYSKTTMLKQKKQDTGVDNLTNINTLTSRSAVISVLF